MKLDFFQRDEIIISLHYPPVDCIEWRCRFGCWQEHHRFGTFSQARAFGTWLGVSRVSRLQKQLIGIFHSSSIGHSLGASLSGLSAGLTKSVSSLSAGAVGKVSSLSSSSSAGAFGHSSGGSSSGGSSSGGDHSVDHGSCRANFSRENENFSSHKATLLFLAYGVSDGTYPVHSTHYTIPETHYSGYEAKPSYGPPKPTISYISEPQSAYGTPEYNGKRLFGNILSFSTSHRQDKRHAKVPNPDEYLKITQEDVVRVSIPHLGV